MIRGRSELADNELDPTFFNDKNEQLIGGLLFKAINSFKKIGKLIGSLIPKLIVYSVLSYTYLSIYDAWGFEKAIILLLVGVVVFAIRTNNR